MEGDTKLMQKMTSSKLWRVCFTVKLLKITRLLVPLN